MTERSLYDQAYLDSGCTLEYDYRTAYETAQWTYSTSYLVAAVCFVIGFILGKTSSSVNMMLFFMLTAASAAYAGVLYQSDTRPGFQLKERLILFTLITASSAMLMRAGIRVWRRSSWITLVWFLAYSGSLTLSLVLESYLTVGITALVTYIAMLGLCFPHITKIVGLLISAGGMMVALVLDGPCGERGYENCFEDCPLSNPTKFSHTTVFHILWAIGLLLIGASEFSNPLPEAPTEEERQKQARRAKRQPPVREVQINETESTDIDVEEARGMRTISLT